MPSSPQLPVSPSEIDLPTSRRQARWLPANRWVRRLLYAGLALLGLWALGWLGVPPLLKWQGEKIASEQLGRVVRIGAVDFKPWTLELTVSDLSVAGVAGAPEQLSVKRLYADIELQSLLRLAPVIDAIQVEAPVLRMAHLGEGRYDFDDVLARLTARSPLEEPGEPARFALYNIELGQGRIEFDDRAVAQRHEVSELRLTLPFISNLPSKRQIKVQPQLAFVANGSAFDSRAEALPFDESRAADAAVRLSGLDLRPYLGYLPAGLPIQLQAATVEADLRVGFEQNPQASLRVDGTLAVSGLKSVDRQGADALSFDTLKLRLRELRPLERKVHLSAVELEGPQLALRRNADGRFDLLTMSGEPGAEKPVAAGTPAAGAERASEPASATTPASQAGDAATPTTPPGWQVVIDHLAVNGGTLDFTDQTTAAAGAPAAVVRLNAFELEAATLGLPFEEPITFSGAFALADTAGLTPQITPDSRSTPARARAAPARQDAAPPAPTAAPSFAFEGRATPQGVEVGARVAGLPLGLAAPYLAAHLAPRLTGVLDAQLGLQWAPPEAADIAPDVKLTAQQLSLRHLMLAETSGASATPTRVARPARRGAGRDGPLASMAQLDLQGLQVDLRHRAIQLERLEVKSPRVTVERSAEQRWMFEDWLRQPAGRDQAAGTPAPGSPGDTGGSAAPAWRVHVNELALTGGTVGWRDRGVRDTVEAELSQLNIDARQLSLDGRKPMPVNLSARLSSRLGGGRTEPGRLSWRGQVGLAPLAAQGAVDAQRLPLHAFEPYFGDALNVDILRADASFKGQVDYTQLAQGPRLRLSGDVGVEELRSHSRPGTAAASDAQTAVATERPPETGAAPQGAESQAALAPSDAAGARAGGLGEELLSWKQLQLAGLDLQMEPGKPPQVGVKDTLLSDFYARLIIHPNGRINLQDVLKSAAGDAAATAPAAQGQGQARAGAPGMPAAGESSAAAESGEGAAGGARAQAQAQPEDPLAPVIRFGPIRLANGRVLFSDRFIRPNYSADLTELNGGLSAFSSVAPADAPQQMAQLELKGRAQGSAALEVTGQLNPLAKPLALDIQGKVTDLELPPLSPYSVKYAGHGIERGKLSMDVAYKVQPDGQLTASNKLVLNQLAFGEPVPDAPASLPVKLATALLADSRGVIDLDLPISGSLNDPQFSLGPIIVKAVVNLIGRAITAPFTLLARALGGADGGDMANVAFEPGSARLTPKAHEQLDKVAQALLERPQLKLTVVGTADLASEREGYRRERLRAMVAAEKRAGRGARAIATPPAAVASAAAVASENEAASAETAGAAASSGPPALAAEVTEAEYPVLLRRLYRRADLPGKPRNAIGLVKDLPVPEMEALLLSHIEVSEDVIRQLAVQRGVAVKDYLASQQLPAERLFLGAPRTGAAQAGDRGVAGAASGAAPAAAAWSPRAELALAAR